MGNSIGQFLQEESCVGRNANKAYLQKINGKVEMRAENLQIKRNLIVISARFNG